LEWAGNIWTKRAYLDVPELEVGQAHCCCVSSISLHSTYAVPTELDERGDQVRRLANKDETYNGSRGKSLGSISSLCGLGGGGTFLSVGDRMLIPKLGYAISSSVVS
jgi:hypothetical protein